MKFYSTRDKNRPFSLREATLQSLPDDGGLFMPEFIPVLDAGSLVGMASGSLADIAVQTAPLLLGNDIPGPVVENICRDAFDFDVPLVNLGVDLQVLELFHGPTLAFKDFGARFLARLLQWLVRGDNRPVTILVATSGDTGGAVAAGFRAVEGVEVLILYPAGKVSPLQEKQLTTYGGNIHAYAINGSFDDCQRLVKMAFSDRELAASFRFASANSINIGRLIPQVFYYLYASTRAETAGKPLAVSVPSGNFGNLCAGLMALRMGAPVSRFIAATNVNDTVPKYLQTGHFEPKPSVPTISNAMDVGNPGNFERILHLFEGKPEHLKQTVCGHSFSDDATRLAIREVFDRQAYILDPHGAVAFLGWTAFAVENPGFRGIVLETAHPAKFAEVVEPVIGQTLQPPPSFALLQQKTSVSITLSADFDSFKTHLLDRKNL